LKNVGHNVYNADDTLTINLVINVLELIIAKYANSVISLPNIDNILDFVLKAKQDQLTPTIVQQRDEFIASAQRSIEQVLHLQGQSDFNSNMK